MINRFAECFATFIARKNHLSDQQQAMLFYNLEIFINKLVVYSILFAASLFISISILLHTLVFIGFFTFLRTRTGGYHAAKNWVCILESFFLCLATVFLAKWISGFPVVPFIVFINFVLSSSIVFKFAPVNHPNLHLSVDEIIMLSKKAKRCIIGQNLVILVTYYTPMPKSYPLTASLTLLSVAILILIGKNKDKEGKMKESRKKLGAKILDALTQGVGKDDRWPPPCVGLMHQPKRPQFDKETTSQKENQ